MSRQRLVNVDRDKKEITLFPDSDGRWQGYLQDVLNSLGSLVGLNDEIYNLEQMLKGGKSSHQQALDDLNKLKEKYLSLYGEDGKITKIDAAIDKLSQMKDSFKDIASITNVHEAKVKARKKAKEAHENILKKQAERSRVYEGGYQDYMNMSNLVASQITSPSQMRQNVINKYLQTEEKV